MSEKDQQHTEHQYRKADKQQNASLIHKIKSIGRLLPHFKVKHDLSERKDAGMVEQIKARLASMKSAPLFPALEQPTDEVKATPRSEEVQKKHFITSNGRDISYFEIKPANATSPTITRFIEEADTRVAGLELPDNSYVFSDTPGIVHFDLGNMYNVRLKDCVRFYYHPHSTTFHPKGYLSVVTENGDEAKIRKTLGYLCQLWPKSRQKTGLDIRFPDPTSTNREGEAIISEKTIQEYKKSNSIK